MTHYGRKGWAVDATWNTVPYAPVEVRDMAGNLACLSDSAGAALANPFNAGRDASYEYYVDRGAYLETVGAEPGFETVPVFLGDPFELPAFSDLDELKYGYGPGEVQAGDKIEVVGLGVYDVAASTAVDHHLTTWSSVKLYVMPGRQGRNAKAFGAVGDGWNDDTTAMQAWVDAAQADGVPGYAPKGTYMTTGLTVDSPLKLVLDSDATIRLSDDGTILTVSANEVEIHGGILDCDRTTNIATAQAITCEGALDDVLIQGVQFLSGRQDFIRFRGGQRFRIKDCRFVNPLNGVCQAIIEQTDADGAVDAYGWEISGNTVVSTQTAQSTACFKVRGNGPQNTKLVRGARFTNNTITCAVGEGNQGLTTGRGVSEMVISGNTFTGGLIGVSLGSFGNNTGIYGLASDADASEDTGFRHGIVSGNTFYGQKAQAIEVSLNVQHTVVNDNVIRKGTGDMTRGILVTNRDNENNRIAGNKIIGAGTYGILLDEFTGANEVVGNHVFISSASATPTPTAIRDEHGSGVSLFEGNLVDCDSTTPLGMVWNDTAGFIARENRVNNSASRAYRLIGSNTTWADILFEGNRKDGAPASAQLTGTFSYGTNLRFSRH